MHSLHMGPTGIPFKQLQNSKLAWWSTWIVASQSRHVTSSFLLNSKSISVRVLSLKALIKLSRLSEFAIGKYPCVMHLMFTFQPRKSLYKSSVGISVPWALLECISKITRLHIYDYSLQNLSALWMEDSHYWRRYRLNKATLHFLRKIERFLVGWW